MESIKQWSEDGYVRVSILYAVYMVISLMATAVCYLFIENVYLIFLFSSLAVFLWIVCYLIWKREWRAFGFHLSISNRDLLLYMPLLGLLVLVGWAGFYSLDREMLMFYALYALLTGIIQETFFRGILLNGLREKGRVAAILFSSFLYTFVVWFQFWEGQGFYPVFQLVLLSFLFGVAMAQVYLLTRNILPLIMFHSFFSYFQFISKEMSIILTVVYVLYLVGLNVFYSILMKKEKLA